MSGGHEPVRLAEFQNGLPDRRGDVGADAQLEAVFAGVAGAAQCRLGVAAGCRQPHQPAVVVAHRVQVAVDQRLQHIDRLGPLQGEHRPKPRHVAPNDLVPAGFGKLRRQVLATQRTIFAWFEAFTTTM